MESILNESKLKHIEKINHDVLTELQSALKKFPTNDLNFIVIMEEVGEFAQAALQLQEKANGSMSKQTELRVAVYKEGIQAISTILNTMLFGDSATTYTGTFCSFGGCTQREIGGPCPLCYE